MLRHAFSGLIVLLILATAPAARADTASDADRRAFETIILDQMAAFRSGDGPRAFAYASPFLQDMFGTPQRFMSMVENGYRPVWRPLAVTFGAVSDTADGLVQEVHLLGPDGNAWIARYTMQRQPDGTWRIAACVLERSADAGA